MTKHGKEQLGLPFSHLVPSWILQPRGRNSRWQTSTVPNRPPTSTDTLCTCPSAEYRMLCTCALSPVPSCPWPLLFYLRRFLLGEPSTDCSMAMCTQKACLRGHTRDSGMQSQIPAGSIWLFLRSTCMPNLKRRVANSSSCEAHNGDIARKNMFSGSYSRLGSAIANHSRLTVTDFWWSRTPNLKRWVRD